MNAAGGKKVAAGSLLGSAGEWMHYVVASWLALQAGGTWVVASYLVLSTVPSTLRLRGPKWLGMVAPIALSIMAIRVGKMRAAEILVLGAAIGLGTALSRRPPAFGSGLLGPPGGGAWIGAGLAGTLTTVGKPELALVLAAAMTTAGLVLGEKYPWRGAIPNLLVPSALAVGFVGGMRVLEVTYGSGRQPTPAVFAVAWALGCSAGWRLAPGADARAVLAAPFIAAMSLAGIGVLTGPALVFLHASVGAAVGLVGGTARAETSRTSFSRIGVVWVSALGAAWVASGARFDSTVWMGAALLIVGAFMSSFAARRVPIPEPEPATRPVAPALEPGPARLGPAVTEDLFVPEPGAVISGYGDVRREAAAVLLDGLRRAREIRGEALIRLGDAISESAALRVVHAEGRAIRLLKERLDALSSRIDALEST